MVNTNSVLSSILFSQTIDWNIKQFFSSTSINSSFELKRIGKAITRRKDQMVVEDDKRYKRITIKTNCGGVFVRDEVLGKDIKTKKQYYVKAGQLAVSKIDARNGAFGIVPPEADGAIITGNFWVYDVNPEIANIDYLILLLSSNVFVQAWQDCSNGSGNRLYLQEEKFLNYKIPMPEADVQKDLIRKYNTQLAEAKKDQDSIDNLQYQIEQYILKKLGISFKRSSFNGLIGTTYYKNLTRWDPTYLSNKIIINSNEKMIDMAAVIAHYQDIVQDNITTSFIPYKDGVTEGDFLIEDYFSWDDTIKAIVEDVIPDRKHPIKMLPNLPDKIKKELEKRINKFEADEFNGFIPLLDKIVELTKEQAV